MFECCDTEGTEPHGPSRGCRPWPEPAQLIDPIVPPDALCPRDVADRFSGRASLAIALVPPPRRGAGLCAACNIRGHIIGTQPRRSGARGFSLSRKSGGLLGAAGLHLGALGEVGASCGQRWPGLSSGRPAREP